MKPKNGRVFIGRFDLFVGSIERIKINQNEHKLTTKSVTLRLHLHKSQQAIKQTPGLIASLFQYQLIGSTCS